LPAGERGSFAQVLRARYLVSLTAIVCAGAVALAMAGAPGDAAFGRGLLELLIVGVPIAAGFYALRAPINARFGIALVFIGLAWSLTALAESSLSVPYTIGRLSTWLIFPSVVYLLFAFPDGRIASVLDRVLFWGVIAVSVVFFYATAPLVTAYPPHTPWATCTSDCPANAVSLVDQPPAFLPNLVLVREWLVMVIWAGIFFSMLQRWRGASALQRRALGPVFLVASVLGVLHIAFHATRELDAPAEVVIALGSAWTVCIVALCGAFLFGLFWRRMLLAGALARLALALRASDDPAAVRDALATTVGDPTLNLLVYEQGSGEWHDPDGRSVAGPQAAAPGGAVTLIGARGGTAEAALVHDPVLRGDEELLDGVSAIVLAGWRYEWLMSDLERAMSDLEGSRRRIAEAADLERARIERDLHDGAQQRLIALRVRLALAEEELQNEPGIAVQTVRELGLEAEHALDELRSLVHGVYPTLLLSEGLPAALRGVARETPIPIQVTAEGVGRYPAPVEGAVYFTCLEAVQNAVKHAAGATAIWIALNQTDGSLAFEVRDDGPGFTLVDSDGRGLRNMRDRIEAIGGHLSIDGEPGRGTRVRGSIDLSPA
jgi:signal transduction histidine kinase